MFKRIAVLTSLCVAAGACDSTLPVPPDALESDLALTSSVDTYASAGATLAGAPTPPTGTPGNADPCVFDAASQFFVCGTMTFSNATYKRKYQLLDVHGEALSTYDRKLVAAIRDVVDRTGTLTTTVAGTATVTNVSSGHSDRTISGLLTATRTVNGRDSSVMTSNGGLTTPLIMRMVHTTTNVVLPTGPAQWPKSGSETISMTITSPSGTGLPTLIVITYNGTATATMTMSTGGVVIRTCQMTWNGKAVAPPVCTP